MSRVVEFCGLPGVGKSTVARQVVDAVTARGVPCAILDAPISAASSRPARIARKVGLLVAEAGRHPLRSAASARSIAASGQQSTRDVAAGWAQWLAVQRMITTGRGEPGVHLVEEGVVQSLWTLGLRASRDDVRPLVERLPESTRPDLLVVVEAPIELARHRLATRPSRHSRTQGLPEAEQLEELRRGQTLLEALVGWVEGPVVRVSNDAPDAVAGIAGRIADLVSSPAPR